MQDSFSVHTLAAAAQTASALGGDPHRIDLTRWLAQVEMLPGADVQTCGWLRGKLADATFNLVVAGQFKRGKSTLINALLGEPLLPVGVVPLTSVVTVIRFGSVPAATIEFRDGGTQAIALDVLAQYVTERGNPNNIKAVSRVVVRYPCPWLADNVQLIDTPGIDSVYEHNSEITRGFIPQADAVIFVASVDQPLGRAEIAFLQSIRPYAAKIFCVLNKIDHLSPLELQESVAFSADCVRQALATPARLYPLSARAAQQRQTDAADAAAGFRDFELALQTFIQADRNTVWRRSVASTLLRMLSQVKFTLELERSALSKPLGQLQQALAELRRRKEQALLAQVEHSVLLQAHARTLQRERVEPELAHFKAGQQIRIVELLDGWYREHRKLPSRRLQTLLEQRLICEVRAAYDDWVARHEPPLARAFDELCARFWSQMRHEIDEVLSASGELFGVTFEAVATDSVWRCESGFHYRFWSEPTSLKILSSAAQLALPRAIGGPLILRRLRARAQELVETHAGRLRSDLESRLDRSIEDFRNRLVAHMRATLERIEEAIGRGIEQYTAGEAAAAERAAALGVQGERAAAIERQLRRSGR